MIITQMIITIETLDSYCNIIAFPVIKETSHKL